MIIWPHYAQRRLSDARVPIFISREDSTRPRNPVRKPPADAWKDSWAEQLYPGAPPRYRSTGGRLKKRNRKSTLRRGSAAARPPLHTNMNEHINAFIARRLAIPKGVEATVQQSGEAREHGSYAKDIRGTVLRKHVILRMSVGEDAANTTSCPMSDRHAVYGIAKSDVTESPGIFVRSYY